MIVKFPWMSSADALDEAFHCILTFHFLEPIVVIGEDTDFFFIRRQSAFL